MKTLIFTLATISMTLTGCVSKTDRQTDCPSLSGKELSDSLSLYCKLHNDTVSANVVSYGLNGDTLEIKLANNTPEMQALFRKKVFDTQLVKLHGPTKPMPFNINRISELEGVTMSVDSVTKDAVKMRLSNKSGRTLSFDSIYGIAQLLPDGSWVKLYSPEIADGMGIELISGEDYVFIGNIHPLINDIVPGTYILYKPVGFPDESGDCIVGCRFQIKYQK